MRLVKWFALSSLLVTLAASSEAAPNNSPAPPQTWHAAPQRESWPAALRDVPTSKLSTGALLRLDHDGDLVEPIEMKQSRVETQSSSHAETAAVTLDRRVSNNIRLGDDPAALPSTQRSQAEPHIARSPIDPDYLLATFQEGRYAAKGGSLDCGYAVSHDGGLNWTRALIPLVGIPSGGPYPRVTDPVAAHDSNGNAFLCTLGATDPDFTNGVVLVSRSSDGGQNFSAPVVAYKPPSNAVMPDKNWIAVNNFSGTSTAGRLLVTFTLFPASQPYSPIARVFSDDGGTTWSAADYIHSTTTSAQGSQPMFLPDGRVAIVYWNFGTNRNPGGGDDYMQVVISPDGGVTYGAPKFITSAALYSEPQIRTGTFTPSATTDRTTGNIYVAYQALFGGVPRILFTKSSNAGDSWTAPIAISNNPGGSGVFNPAISASPDGQRLTVEFYDHRNNPGSGTLIDTYLAQSFDGGATWQPNIRLSSVSTDASRAPLTDSGYMLGDYLGIAESTNVNVPAVPVWIDTRSGNPDPFVTRVGIAPTLDFTSWQAARLSLGQINDPSLGGEAGDADHDGEDNLSEFRSATEPNDPLSVFRTGRQLDIATRARVLTGNDVLIAGFIITGNDPKKVIVRAIGPSLAQTGISGPLEDPTLDLRGSSGTSIATNDDWRRDDEAGVQSTGLAPSDDRESAIVQTLAPGAYTAVVRGKNDSTGVAVVEAYDLSPTGNSRLANLSSRAVVGTDENVIIGGVIVGAGQGVNGAGSARVLVRGIGPSLAQAGVANPLDNPELELVDGNGTLIATNNDWADTQAADIQATGIAPTDQRESALLVTLTQGAYTAILRGGDRTTGTAVVETYNLP